MRRLITVLMRRSLYARHIEVKLYKDGSVEVIDDGRGMLTDIHPEHKVSGVELILTRLHAGAKFSSKTYEFSGGLHGVGISVVNALSSLLTVSIKKDGKIMQMQFKGGEPAGKLKSAGTCPKSETARRYIFFLMRSILILLNFYRL